ncbi:DUF1501 domain-containing protein [Phenylobacterium montanum]|uniref:DUF1501 domain-containing protein n=1 Tax=Phenylobacterium montanum TaxID=2823693 RepID=A0A975G3F1_9CAUL|nr:DUF1501 domain-containing protein [Caulobacter sp. S6]QUD90079.1 DUF1501 domain-containing protein [Caulobacter sp. S6]
MTDSSRRDALKALGAVGVTFLAAPAIAASPAGDRKLVVIVCRGAMDGLSVAPPLGDPDYLALRGPIAIPADRALKLDADFGLHPKLATIAALAGQGQARIAPAVAIPERIRSHFEAQDLLETGGARLYGSATGWLNRALAASGPGRPIKALSIGAQSPLILKGPIETQSWSPGGRLTPDITRVSQALQELYLGDPLLGPALASGMQTEATADALGGLSVGQRDVKGFAVTAARFLTAEGGPQVAVISLTGFDTHANQGAAEGQLANHLQVLDDVVAGLQEGLGPAWSRTVVVAATEFGRTAHINGTGGTDHGTAGAMILAGGALKRGGIVGDWPTLKPDALFENRDLAPTLDVRQVFKGVLRDHLGLDRRTLDSRVFPDSAAAAPTANLVA